MRTYALAAAALLSLARVAPAQSVGTMLVDDAKHFGSDVLGIWTSPFRATSKDWLLAGAAVGAFGVSMLADRSVSDWAIDNKDRGLLDALGPVRRGGAVYTGKNIVPPVAAVYALGLAFKNQDMRDFVTGCGTAWFAQSVMRKGVYALVARQRPDTSPDNPQKWEIPGDRSDWQSHSFPAGHFANAMSCATFWNNRFDTGWGAPIIYAAATAIGVGRLADGGHWTSDTVIGGILGYAVGREIARRSRARKEDNPKSRTADRIEWQMGPQLGGASAAFRFSF